MKSNDKRLIYGLVIVCMLLSVSTIYLWLGLNSMEGKMNLPISSIEAMNITLKNETVQEFTLENFKDPRNRINSTYLVQNPDQAYSWRVEIVERECGCGGIVSLSVVITLIDPESGDIENIELLEGIKENEYAKRSCMEECH